MINSTPLKWRQILRKNHPDVRPVGESVILWLTTLGGNDIGAETNSRPFGNL